MKRCGSASNVPMRHEDALGAVARRLAESNINQHSQCYGEAALPDWNAVPATRPTLASLTQALPCLQDVKVLPSMHCNAAREPTTCGIMMPSIAVHRRLSTDEAVCFLKEQALSLWLGLFPLFQVSQINKQVLRRSPLQQTSTSSCRR